MDLAKGEGVAMSCHSGKLLNVHWKCNSYKSVDNFVEHRLSAVPMTRG